MKIIFGKDFFAHKNSNKHEPVVMDTTALINGHAFIVGSSGVGKSHTIKKMIEQGQNEKTNASFERAKQNPNPNVILNVPVRFHVFDVHGDLEISNASTITLSEQMDFGLNPFIINPDPHFGGVRKCIQAFIRIINQASSTALGLKQEAVIRNLLLDVFKEFGFEADNPKTWALNEYDSVLVSGGMDNRIYLQVPIEQKDAAKNKGARWDPDRKLWWVSGHKYMENPSAWEWPPAFKKRNYPSLKDVCAYADRLYKQNFLGSDQKAVQSLLQFNKKAHAYQKKLLGVVKQNHFKENYSEGLTLSLLEKEELNDAKLQAIEAYTKYVEAIQTGIELDTLLKYDSLDVLKSVSDRLNNLLATGIFRGGVLPFDPIAPVWRYKLNALSQEEKKMFVLFTMQDIFNTGMQRGETPDVVEVVVLDELGVYTSSQDDESGDGIIGTIAREARKFGLAIWAANQSPANIPESLISSVAVKIILGIDEMYWKSAVSRLRIETKLLEWIQPRWSIAVQMKEKGALKNRWRWILL